MSRHAPMMLMVGEFWFGTTGSGLAHGFRQLGWDVEELDISASFIRARGRCLRAIARFTETLAINDLNRRIVEACWRVKPDIVLFVKGSYITSSTMDAVKQSGAIRVMYYPDISLQFPELSQAALDKFDLFVTSKSYQLPVLEQRLGPRRAAFVHHGYHSLAHVAKSDDRFADGAFSDVIYLANHSAHKQRFMEAVGAAFPSIRLAIVGNRWAEALAGTALASSAFAAVTGDLYRRAIQESRISIGVHMGQLGSEGWADLTSTRTFEIPACGGFMLHEDNEEVRTLFAVGEEIDVFQTPEALCERIGYYLAHDDQRRDMSQRGRQRATPAYSYDARAAEIAALLDQRGIWAAR